MAQHDYVIANGTGAAVRSDLNNALAAIVSQNSGAVAPTTTYAYMPWADTGSSPPVFKIRNAANNGWITLYELDGTFSVEAGSASSPGLYFTGDINTGIYSPGADQFGISTGGTSRLTIDASGNINMDSGTVYVDAANNRLGIGTTSPAFSLDIVGDLRVTNSASSTIIVNRTSNPGSVAWQHSGTETGQIQAVSGGGLNFYTGSSPSLRATLDNSGRLLVGTSSAAGDFFNGTFTGRFQLHGAASESERGFLHVYANNQGASAGGGPFLAFGTSNGSTSSSRTVVVNGGELGIISFQGADGTDMVEAARIAAVVDGTPGANDMPGRIVLSTTADGASSPTERMRIDSTGKAVITAINNNANAMEIYNNSGTTPYGIYLGLGADSNDATRYFLYCAGGATQRVTLRSNGGIANYSANNVNLSDRNVKKDITPAPGTWDCLKEWEIVNFRYKDQPDDADLNMGVIAQQVAESCPEVITVFQEAKEATEDQPAQEERIGVKEQQMMWMAIKALQEAQVRIETLEAEVAALKAS